MEPQEKSGKPKDQPAKKSGIAPKRKVGQGDKQGSANQRVQPDKKARQSAQNFGQGGELEREQGVMGLSDDEAGSADVDPQAIPGTAISEDSDERHQKISAAAYARAERRGFEPGKEEEDWLNAEAELYGGYTRDGEEEDGKREQRPERDQSESQ